MPGRGRPAYQPTDKDTRIVEMLAGWSMPQEKIARVIGVDPKTLRRYYREALDAGAAKLEAQLAHNLLRISQGKDRQALIATIFALKSRFGWVEAAPEPRPPPLGKKEAARLAAETAGEGSDWGDLLKVPPPPARYRHAMEH